MAVTNTVTPPSVVLAKNPVAFTFSTNQYKLTVGNKAFISLIIGSPVAGQSFIIKYNGLIITMTAVSGTPDDSGTQFPIRIGGESTIDYNNRLLPFLKQNYYLSRDFTLNFDPAFLTIYFRAKDWGILDLITTTSLTSSTIGTAHETAPSYHENFKFVFDVFLEKNYGSAIYENIGNHELDPDSNSTCVFDIKDIVSQYFELELPDLSINSPLKLTEIIKRFYINYSEKYGVIPVYKRVLSSSIFLALNGGIKKNEWDVSFDLIAYLISNKKFLSWRPLTREISATQPEYLTFFCYNSLCLTARLWIHVSYTDGATVDTSVQPVFASAVVNEVYRIPIGLRQLGIHLLNPTKTVSSYQVYLEREDGFADLTEKIRYNIALDDDTTRYFVYFNSFNALEILRATGYVDQGLLVNGNTVETALPYNYDKEKGAFILENAQTNNRFKANTGIMTRSELTTVSQEFFKSKYKAQIINSALIPIVIESKDERIIGDNDDLPSMDFTYSFGFDDENYSQI